MLTAEGSLGTFVTLTVPPPYAFPRKSGLRARSHRIAPHVTSYMGSATSVVDNFGRSPRPGRLRTCPRERRHLPSSDPSVQQRTIGTQTDLEVELGAQAGQWQQQQQRALVAIHLWHGRWSLEEGRWPVASLGKGDGQWHPWGRAKGSKLFLSNGLGFFWLSS